MIRATDIHSLTDFTRNAKTYIQQIRESKCPMAITVNGDAQVVIQDAETFQTMVDELKHSRVIASIQDSKKSVKAGEALDLEGSIRSLPLLDPTPYQSISEFFKDVKTTKGSLSSDEAHRQLNEMRDEWDR